MFGQVREELEQRSGILRAAARRAPDTAPSGRARSRRCRTGTAWRRPSRESPPRSAARRTRRPSGRSPRRRTRPRRPWSSGRLPPRRSPPPKPGAPSRGGARPRSARRRRSSSRSRRSRPRGRRPARRRRRAAERRGAVRTRTLPSVRPRPKASRLLRTGSVSCCSSRVLLLRAGRAAPRRRRPVAGRTTR